MDDVLAGPQAEPMLVAHEGVGDHGSLGPEGDGEDDDGRTDGC